MRNVRWLTMLAVTFVTIPPLVRELPNVAADPPDDAALRDLTDTKTPDREQPDLEHQVRRLLIDLADAGRATRVEAERKLLALGPQVLVHLPAPELLPSNSVREAVRRIRVQLERIAAVESVLPARVTLDERMSLAATLADISKQTGNLVVGRSLPAGSLRQMIEIKADSVPFWQALDQLTSRHKLHYEYDVTLAALKLLPDDTSAPPSEHVVDYVGAFRLAAPPALRSPRAVGAARDKKLAAREDLLRVALFLRPEPRLRPLFLAYATREVKATLPDQSDLPSFTPGANVELALSEGAGQSRIQLDFVVPESIPLSTIDVRGKLKCTTALGKESIRFTEITALADRRELNIARRRGGVTATLTRVEAASRPGGKHDLQINVVVTYDTGGPAFESHRSWMLHNEVYLEDPSGKRLPLNGGSETTQQGNDGLGIAYRFVGLPDPLPEYSFIYVAPTMIVDVPIEFVLKAIPVRTRQ